MSDADPVPKPQDIQPPATSSDGELRAQFASTGIVAPPPSNIQPQTSPLLSLTPPTVAKALIRAYPYLLIVNKTLLVATWTNDDYWVNVVLMLAYTLAVLYFEALVTWTGHLLLVLVVVLYSLLNSKILEETSLRPTLDDVVQALTATCIKADLLLSPVTAMALTSYDIKRLLFTTVFLTPLYLVATFLLISPRSVLLLIGLFLLSYHLPHMCVTRKLVWKLKISRVLCFYLTGLDFSQAKNNSLFAAAFAKVHKTGVSPSAAGLDGSKPVRFTYVIYENQRRWLGIGWTSNLLTYERAPWTDEFLNESSSTDSFELPNADSSFSQLQQDFQLHSAISGARWRWVDKTWRLDLTNDGAIVLPSSKRSKTTVKPTNDEGFIYTDNVWKKPTTDDSYSKYTRRRRWIRTAELVFDSATAHVSDGSPSTFSTSVANSSPDLTRKRKSLRFADEDEHKEVPDAIETDVSEEKRPLHSTSAKKND
ncbi:Pex24p-domain-containing protein [Metschnikowia bicuspidata var. bicuspidata NRRL YB-4993]|uniref:Pex24p-domain-containing protein n=1 Tax=Metschnikowia bicuspidata var. bicuspidata NRRL YB-4993 TaxID=869754 RepID=A0A1A0HG62_9ASCO|nr:Pex24p-domain-containing protein [Metschnikowia bicuspidata var. bicuspidata NRRL YB-4993]OBA23154.1 Pex24p-domain-containing protein [Metschnikowia bicuspidata var. bicuspidata NRRL YB-4993]